MHLREGHTEISAIKAVLDSGKYTIQMKLLIPRGGVDPLPIQERALEKAMERLWTYEAVKPDPEATEHIVDILKHSDYYVIEFGVRAGEYFWDSAESEGASLERRR